MQKNGGYIWIQSSATIAINAKNANEKNIIWVNYLLRYIFLSVPLFAFLLSLHESSWTGNRGGGNMSGFCCDPAQEQWAVSSKVCLWNLPWRVGFFLLPSPSAAYWALWNFVPVGRLDPQKQPMGESLQWVRQMTQIATFSSGDGSDLKSLQLFGWIKENVYGRVREKCWQLLPASGTLPPWDVVFTCNSFIAERVYNHPLLARSLFCHRVLEWSLNFLLYYYNTSPIKGHFISLVVSDNLLIISTDAEFLLKYYTGCTHFVFQLFWSGCSRRNTELNWALGE